MFWNLVPQLLKDSQGRMHDAPEGSRSDPADSDERGIKFCRLLYEGNNFLKRQQPMTLVRQNLPIRGLAATNT